MSSERKRSISATNWSAQIYHQCGQSITTTINERIAVLIFLNSGVFEEVLMLDWNKGAYWRFNLCESNNVHLEGNEQLEMAPKVRRDVWAKTSNYYYLMKIEVWATSLTCVRLNNMRVSSLWFSWRSPTHKVLLTLKNPWAQMDTLFQSFVRWYLRLPPSPSFRWSVPTVDFTHWKNLNSFSWWKKKNLSFGARRKIE